MVEKKYTFIIRALGFSPNDVGGIFPKGTLEIINPKMEPPEYRYIFDVPLSKEKKEELRQLKKSLLEDAEGFHQKGFTFRLHYRTFQPQSVSSSQNSGWKEF